MLAADDLVVTGATLGNPPFEVLVEAARAGGFHGLSLWPRETYARARSAGATDAELRARLADAGLVVNDVDALIRWLGPGAPAGLSGPSEADLFTAGEALGASFVNVVFASAGPVGIDEASEAFAGIAVRAAQHGLRAHLEFVPFMTVADARQAWRIVEASGCVGCGLMVDSWHCFRGPTTFEDLRAIPGERVLGLQVNDAPVEAMPDPVLETLHHRLVPGEGAIDLVGWLGTLRAAGCRAPLTVEVFSDRLLAENTPVEAAVRLGDAIRAVRARL